MTDFDTAWRERFGEGVEHGAGPSGEEWSRLEGFLTRRSCRRFAGRPVEEALLEALLACAQSAPSKSDLQQYSIVVIDDPALRGAMQTWASFDDWIAKAPFFLVFCGDLRRQRRIAEMRGYDHRNDNLDTFMNTAVDAGIALATFVAAAEAAGLGCCPISVVRNHIGEACDLLGLPDGVYPVAGLALGWPEKTAGVSMRLPPAAVVHRNRYRDDTLPDLVAGYDAARHAVQPIAPHKQRHPDKYGVAETCHWSENTARQMSVPERAGFADFLRKRGFSLS